MYNAKRDCQVFSLTIPDKSVGFLFFNSHGGELIALFTVS